MRSDKPAKPLFADTDLLPELPQGVQFRQAEVWAGLEQSLQARRRKAVVLRFAAAAALLLALALGWWLRPQGSAPRDVARKTPAPASPLAVPTTTVPAIAKAPVEIQPEAPLAALAKTGLPKKRAGEPVELRSMAPRTPAPDSALPAPEPQAAWTAAATPAAAAPATPAPTRRFRIGHINDNNPQPPVLADLPAEERPNNAFFHLPGTGNAGPNPDAAEPATERKPRTLMSLFKPHQ